MSEWPKFNRERHENGWCVSGMACGEVCVPDRPCRCCETARADAAEAAVERVRAACEVPSISGDFRYLLGRRVTFRAIARALGGGAE